MQLPIPNAPAVPIAAAPVLRLLAVVAAFAVAGLVSLRRRDLARLTQRDDPRVRSVLQCPADCGHLSNGLKMVVLHYDHYSNALGMPVVLGRRSPLRGKGVAWRN